MMSSWYTRVTRSGIAHLQDDGHALRGDVPQVLIDAGQPVLPDHGAVVRDDGHVAVGVPGDDNDARHPLGGRQLAVRPDLPALGEPARPAAPRAPAPRDLPVAAHVRVLQINGGPERALAARPPPFHSRPPVRSASNSE